MKCGEEGDTDGLAEKEGVTLENRVTEAMGGCLVLPKAASDEQNKERKGGGGENGESGREGKTEQDTQPDGTYWEKTDTTERENQAKAQHSSPPHTWIHDGGDFGLQSYVPCVYSYIYQTEAPAHSALWPGGFYPGIAGKSPYYFCSCKVSTQPEQVQSQCMILLVYINKEFFGI